MEITPQPNAPFLTPRELGRLFLFTILAIMMAQAVSLFLQAKFAMMLQELCIVIPALIFVIRKKLPMQSTFRLSFVTPTILLYGVILSLTVVVLTDELDRVINSIFPMPEELAKAMEQMMLARTGVDALFIILSAVVIASIAEEMLFRGIILNTLEQFKDAASAIVLTAVFFALVHFNPWGSIQIAVLGFALGYLAWKSQSIWPGVIMHALNNLLAYLWVNLPRESWSWYCGETHIKIQWLILAVLLLVFSVDRFNKACETTVVQEELV